MTFKLAILASGSGSNAENIIHYFANDAKFSFPIIISNKKNAYVHQRAKILKIPSITFTNQDFKEAIPIIKLLHDLEIDYIVLAGFLLKISNAMIQAYPNRIINIHPALLPKYGGKGMYGHFVHQAVVDAREPESGITIHYVNENYDEGNIIFQAKCQLLPTDTAEDLAAKVHALEYEFYPKVISELWDEERTKNQDLTQKNKEKKQKSKE